MTVDDQTRVCLECGKPPGAGSFCQFCGANLSTVSRLPTHGEWLAQQTAPEPSAFPPPPAPTTPKPTGPPDPPPIPKPLGPPPPPNPQSSQLLAAAATLIGAETSPAADPPYGESPATPAESSQEHAHWGYRTGAFFFQLGLVGTVALAVSSAGDAAGWTEDEASTSVGIVIFGLWFLISAFPFVFSRGQSVGMMLAGTRMVNPDGKPTGFGRAFLREYVCVLLFLIPFFLFVEWLMPLGSKRKSVRDNIMNTAIVKTPEYSKRAWLLTGLTIIVVGVWTAWSVVDPVTDGLDEVADRAAFMDECTKDSGPSDSTCGCIYTEFRSNYTTDEYIALSEAMSDDDAPAPQHVIDEVADARDTCTP